LKGREDSSQIKCIVEVGGKFVYFYDSVDVLSEEKVLALINEMYRRKGEFVLYVLLASDFTLVNKHLIEYAWDFRFGMLKWNEVYEKVFSFLSSNSITVDHKRCLYGIFLGLFCFWCFFVEYFTEQHKKSVCFI